MTVSVRLDKRMDKQLSDLAARTGRSKSDVLRDCLKEYLERHASTADAWELGKDLFGRFGSGRSDLSERAEEVLRERFAEKRRGRRRRA